ncbi:sensor histidine kinase [Paenibacillus sp. sptzw28]|uniref:sensor histidine kinase n=1 Tax=Paenibacillus sp. sptzw28 TaxID=715179 RepID=UPI002161AD46|nr:sensor histidine kinase [Paenibacillus sp. sptzw28]
MEIWNHVTQYLTDSDIQYLQRFAQYLPYIADICQADVFIDCAASADLETALVVAEAFPSTARSLYRKSVVGELAYAVNEPGVIACLKAGHPVLGSRGISQEFVEMEQNVTPIKNQSGSTIGALIVERDISANVRQEKHVELLRETTEQLGSALMQSALSEAQLPSLIQEGMLLFDAGGTISYANELAARMLEGSGINGSIVGLPANEFYFAALMSEVLGHGGIRTEKWDSGQICIQLKAVALMKEGRTAGGMLLMRDISELKQKEKKLLLQSAVIKEIHHRVKNNLQMISSLLNLQSRRLEQPEMKAVFRESISRIGSISLVHEMLAREGLDEMDAAEMLERMASLFISSMSRPGQNIAVSVRADSLTLKSDQATHLSLIVNELIQNSFNHAFAHCSEGAVEISLRASRNEAVLLFRDTGRGLHTEDVNRNNGQLGMQILRTLVEEGLQGIVRFSDEENKGFQTRIVFPLGSGGEADASL